MTGQVLVAAHSDTQRDRLTSHFKKRGRSASSSHDLQTIATLCDLCQMIGEVG
jgi:hypothetical protein